MGPPVDAAPDRQGTEPKSRPAAHRGRPWAAPGVKVAAAAVVLMALVAGLWAVRHVEPPEPAPAAPSPRETAPEEAARDAGDPDVLWSGTFASRYGWKDDFGVVVTSRDNAEVVAEGPGDRRDVLRVTFGEDGSRWGMDLRHSFAAMGVEPREEVYFSYDVYFPADFEFVGDGKMGGLAGIAEGLDPLEASSGGDYDESSFSVRAMWKKDRGVVMYLYARHADGRDFDHPDNYGYGISKRFVKGDGNESDVFKPGSWHRVEHHVSLNTPGHNDGVYEMWVDGHRGISLNDVQYRTEAVPDLTINQLFSAWFFGGSSDQYPSRRNVAYTDNWALTADYLGPEGPAAR